MPTIVGMILVSPTDMLSRWLGAGKVMVESTGDHVLLDQNRYRLLFWAFQKFHVTCVWKKTPSLSGTTGLRLHRPRIIDGQPHYENRNDSQPEL